MKDEYIEVSLEDYNNKSRIIIEQREEIINLKKRITDLEKELHRVYNK